MHPSQEVIKSFIVLELEKAGSSAAEFESLLLQACEVGGMEKAAEVFKEAFLPGLTGGLTETSTLLQTPFQVANDLGRFTGSEFERMERQVDDRNSKIRELEQKLDMIRRARKQLEQHGN